MCAAIDSRVPSRFASVEEIIFRETESEVCSVALRAEIIHPCSKQV
jgi:hypothetical protein